MSRTETAKATESSSAVLGLNAGTVEPLRAIGVYHATLNRCKTQHESEYLPLNGHLKDLTDRFRAIDRQIVVPENFGLAMRSALRARNVVRQVQRNKLRNEIGQIESYLQTLTEPVKELLAPNLVTTVGRNFILDNNFAGSSYTATYFMGLVSLASFTAYAAADTMASHAGWLEAGATNAPTYSGARKTAAWSAAASGSKSLSAGLVFTFTGTGTVKGCFMNTVSTVDGTTGTLTSAGNFTGGDQPVISTNTLTVTYAATLT